MPGSFLIGVRPDAAGASYQALAGWLADGVARLRSAPARSRPGVPTAGGSEPHP